MGLERDREHLPGIQPSSKIEWAGWRWELGLENRIMGLAGLEKPSKIMECSS